MLTPACSSPQPDLPGQGRAEILWDTWGTPHIFAGDQTSLLHAFGYAQMHSHGKLLLQLYAQARGEAASYLGPDYLDSDRVVRIMDLRTRGEQWYEVQSPQTRQAVDAFAAGVNEYAAKHPDEIDDALRPVLPVRGTDVFAHVARTMFGFLSDTAGCREALPTGSTAAAGSNGWALGPARTANQDTLLLANPHLGWSGGQVLYESQLAAPGVNVYGAALVGFPADVIGFNDMLGWTHTVNPIDACDVYELTPDGDGYLFDGAKRAFETRTATIGVRQPDGSVKPVPVLLRRSVQGPVVEVGGRLAAIRVAAVGQTSVPGLIDQWWAMARAQNFPEFRDALRRNQLPMFNVIYADRDKHVYAAFAGQVPVRPAAYTGRWDQPIPGATSSTLWTDVHAFDQLPQVLDPPGGFVQNSNSSPWTFTLPRVPELDPARYPSYFPGDQLSWRERRGLRMIEEHPGMSLDELGRLKYDTRMELADRVLPELIAAADTALDNDAQRGAAVLSAWDRQANPDSNGALLFLAWTLTALPGGAPADGLFRVPYDPADPLDTPRDLVDPQRAVAALGQAVRTLQKLAGSIQVPWGQAARMVRGSVNLPANGFPGDPYGVFRVLSPDIGELESGKPAQVTFGDSYVAEVEFGSTTTARVLMTYGNSSRPGSPHFGDQLALSAAGQMRPAWRDRTEIEAHLEDRTTFP